MSDRRALGQSVISMGQGYISLILRGWWIRGEVASDAFGHGGGSERPQGPTHIVSSRSIWVSSFIISQARATLERRPYSSGIDFVLQVRCRTSSMPIACLIFLAPGSPSIRSRSEAISFSSSSGPTTRIQGVSLSFTNRSNSCRMLPPLGRPGIESDLASGWIARSSSPLPKTRFAQKLGGHVFGLFNSGEVFVQFFGCEKCGGVDPLKLLAGWIPFPVGIRNGE